MADPAPPPPRASLLGLPTEIKAHIVKLAKQADEHHYERVASEGEVDGATADNVWYGRSTNALFLVNKELQGLAAEHIFLVHGCYDFAGSGRS